MDSDVFLDKNKPSYIGGILEMMTRGYMDFGETTKWIKERIATKRSQISRRFIGKLQGPKSLNEFVNALSGVQMGALSVFLKN